MRIGYSCGSSHTVRTATRRPRLPAVVASAIFCSNDCFRGPLPVTTTSRRLKIHDVVDSSPRLSSKYATKLSSTAIKESSRRPKSSSAVQDVELMSRAVRFLSDLLITSMSSLHNEFVSVVCIVLLTLQSPSHPTCTVN
jgi:hypothetical protein